MAEIKRFPVSFEHDGKSITGEYEIDGRSVTTYYAGRHMSTWYQGTPIFIARTLLREMSEDQD